MKCRFAMIIALLVGGSAQAGLKSRVARETAEHVMKTFGKETAGESVEVLTGRIGKLAAEFGDDVAIAAKNVGPRAIDLIEAAGTQGTEAARLLARYGDDAVWVVGKPDRLGLVARYGDDAAEAMMRHGEITEPLLREYGGEAAAALRGLSGQNSRRLAIMAQEGELAAIGKTTKLLAVITRYGDHAMEFIWKNKGALTVSTALIAFLAHPEPFLDGVKDITSIAAENVAKPVVEAAGQVAAEVARQVNWTVVLLLMAAVCAGLCAVISGLLRRKLRRRVA
jgi:hypothetical protein